MKQYQFLGHIIAGDKNYTKKVQSRRARRVEGKRRRQARKLNR
jgi:hypothetical protein